jgi:hypothetical protein
MLDTATLATRLSKRHDRYAIYRVIGKTIRFITSKNNEHTGTAQRVCRDVFDNVVEMTVGGRSFRFKEPTIMAMDGNAVVFVYGDSKRQNQSDKALFTEMKHSVFHNETVNDVITRTAPIRHKIMRFELVA